VWACAGAGVFPCASDADCGGTFRAGVCETQGWCSFPDPGCPSQRRFGEHSGDGLAGECVSGQEMSAATSDEGGADSGGSESSDGADTMPALPGDDDTTTAAAASSDGTDPDPDSEGTTGDPPEAVPIAWYPFDTRDPWADATRNALDGACTTTECPQTATGVAGSGIELDGSDDHLAIAHTPLLETTDSVSIALWAQSLAAGAAGYRTLAAKPVGSAAFNSWEVSVADDAVLHAYFGDAVVEGHVEAPWPADAAWHHVAATWDGTMLRLYLDGLEVDAAALAVIGFDDHPMIIGADIDNDNPFVWNMWEGRLDEIHVYDGTLAPTAIAAIAARG
jgi:hypothetical protein